MVRLHDTVQFYPADGAPVQFAIVTAVRDVAVESVQVSQDTGELMMDAPRAVTVHQVCDLHIPSTNDDVADVAPGNSAGHYEPLANATAQG